VNRRSSASGADTFLIVECGGMYLAFPSVRVVGARLADGVEIVKSRFDDSGAGERARLPPVAMIDGESWVAWDLGLLVGRRAARHAWVLVRLSYADTTLRLALRTGRCLAVSAPRERSSLPRGMFMRRPGALGAAFLIDETMNVSREATGQLCLVVDVPQLWNAHELQLSAHALGIMPALQAVP
jgi:hypothetical protein